MKKGKKGRYYWVTLPVVMLYIIAASFLCVKIRNLNMFPASYFGILLGIQALLAVLFLVMQRKKPAAVVSAILSFLLGAGFLMGAFYLERTQKTLSQVTVTTQENAFVSVYVKKDSVAETLKDIVDYKIGILKDLDLENTKKAAAMIEEEQETTLSFSEYENMLSLVQDLTDGNLRSILLNDAYMDVIKEIPGYEKIEDSLRKIKTFETTAEPEEEQVSGEPAAEENSGQGDSASSSFIAYISGIDTYGGLSARSRSDVNILAVVNPEVKEILLLSTPRDYYVEYSVTGGQKDKLTHAGIYGVEASMDALQRLYGIQIDYYARMNFTGFVDIIDALGGIDVYSDTEFTVANVMTYYPGYNHVNGREALAFARERYSFADGDYHRAKDQMEVIRAVVDKCASSALLANYDSVMDGIEGSFETSMPQEKISELIRMQLKDTTKWQIQSYTASGTGKMAETYSMPGQALSVIEPDSSSVEEAKRLIREIREKTK